MLIYFSLRLECDFVSIKYILCLMPFFPTLSISCYSFIDQLFLTTFCISGLSNQSTHFSLSLCIFSFEATPSFVSYIHYTYPLCLYSFLYLPLADCNIVISTIIVSNIVGIHVLVSTDFLRCISCKL